MIDSFPVAVCDNIRISRSKLLKGKQWRGKHSSMRRYFYGVKVQALKKLPLAVAAESKIYGDAAYTNYRVEDDMKAVELVELMICRKRNSKRPDQPWMRFIKEQRRKAIETSFRTHFLTTIPSKY